ncbi:MAG TPA: hypothetical protein VG538_05900 [Vicinamibacterales bacterium]|jgi:hypothetical protein|nr:hypothetical protein [Vicinamibacterales bacterium]
MTPRRAIYWTAIPLAAVLSLVTLSAQRQTRAWVNGLFVDLDRHRVVVLADVPDDWQVCAATSPAAEPHGCVSVRVMRRMP